MKLTATEQGLLIPKELLGEEREFEVIQEQEKIILISVKKTSSIWNLGSNPVECEIEDGAINGDYYLDNQGTEKPQKQRRPIGLCAGEFVVPDDFNDPLPEEIINLFENP